MPRTHTIARALEWGIAGVWLANGLYAKVLGGVPRHEAIAARVLGDQAAATLIPWIGWAECLMAIWVLSPWTGKLCAFTQVGLVMLMNCLELWLAADLLLWGRLNFVYASLFCALVLFCELYLRRGTRR